MTDRALSLLITVVILLILVWVFLKVVGAL